MVARYKLTEAERGDLSQLARVMVPPYAVDRYEPFSNGCIQAAAKVGPSLFGWASKVRECSVGLLENALVEASVPTPLVKSRLDGVAMEEDAVFGTLASLVGRVVTFEGKCVARHIHNLYPAIDEEHSQLGASSEALDWHVEDAFHPERADWLGILCLRGDLDVVTKVARLGDIALPEETWSRLRRRNLRLTVDHSFREGFAGRTFSRTTIEGDVGQSEVSFDPYYTEYEDAGDRVAADEFARAAERAAWSFNLKAGDFLLLNNRKTIHARSDHAPRRDGTDRWIKRAVIVDHSKASLMSRDGLIGFPYSASDIGAPPG